MNFLRRLLLRRFLYFFSGRKSSKKGLVMIEMAIVLVLFLGLVFAIIELSFMWVNYNLFHSAVADTVRICNYNTKNYGSLQGDYRCETTHDLLTTLEKEIGKKGLIPAKLNFHETETTSLKYEKNALLPAGYQNKVKSMAFTVSYKWEMLTPVARLLIPKNSLGSFDLYSVNMSVPTMSECFRSSSRNNSIGHGSC